MYLFELGFSKIIFVEVMTYPLMVQFLMEKYGFRGTMAIIAAINSHAIFGMLVMHPVDWHCKIVKVSVDEDEPCKFHFYL